MGNRSGNKGVKMMHRGRMKTAAFSVRPIILLSGFHQLAGVVMTFVS